MKLSGLEFKVELFVANLFFLFARGSSRIETFFGALAGFKVRFFSVNSTGRQSVSFSLCYTDECSQEYNQGVKFVHCGLFCQ